MELQRIRAIRENEKKGRERENQRPLGEKKRHGGTEATMWDTFIFKMEEGRKAGGRRGGRQEGGAGIGGMS